MICVPIAAGGLEEALEKMERATPLADLIELRMDRMPGISLEPLLRARRIPALVTNRRREEGGDFTGTEAERLSTLAEAVRLGADYIDIEAATDPALKGSLRQALAGSRTRLIVSWHDFSGTPPAGALEKKLAACLADGADIAKIVTRADSGEDNLRILALIPQALKQGRAISAFCMGRMGKMSRIAAPLLGSAITYASLEEGEASAPGQLTARRMRDIMFLLEEGSP